MKCSKLFGSLAHGLARSSRLHRRVRTEGTTTDDWLHPPGIPLAGLPLRDQLGEGPLDPEPDTQGQTSPTEPRRP